jgi:diguanylate cyclase (GGDEF)-like protein
MSSRRRIHVLLLIVVCVVGAGIVSAAIQRSASNADFAEFAGVTPAVMLPGTDPEGARKVADNLREAIASLAVTGIERAITASFGVAVLPEDAPQAQALLRAADRALYQAKADGRDRVELAAV